MINAQKIEEDKNMEEKIIKVQEIFLDWKKK